MYRLATMHSITDRWTGRKTDDSIMPCMQYDRLKTKRSQNHFNLILLCTVLVDGSSGTMNSKHSETDP